MCLVASLFQRLTLHFQSRATLGDGFYCGGLQCRVARAANLEATAWGAARCAAIGHGLLDLTSDVTLNGDIFTPTMKKDEQQQLLTGWHAAVESCIKLNA